MKSRYILFVVIVVLAVLAWLFFPKNINNSINYTNTVYGISFSYPTTYSLEERDVPEGHRITLINKNDLPLPVNGEGPPAITIDIYKNSSIGYTTEGWIQNSKESNIKLGEGILATTTISELSALSFRWSGLYEGTTIAVARPEFVYVFSVTYMEMGAPIVQDFVKIRDSVKISK